MKRSFGNLLEEFRRLGSQVIYASFDKLVISTSKSNFKIGGAYSTYLLSALQKNPLFEHLELKAVKFWDYLIWLDPYNNGGIMHVEQTAEEGMEADGFDVELDMKWDIAEYLPPMAQEAFENIIANFIGTVKQLKENELCNDFHTELSAALGSSIKRTLYKLVGDMHKRRFLAANAANQADEAMVFPSLPGCCRPLTNASLEFIKMVTAVFELDKNLLYEVRLLRRDLLKLIGFAEFSGEARFSNPCEVILT
jgi:DNA polymerase epsilon subunit 1